MSWHWLVMRDRCVPDRGRRPARALEMAPLFGSAKMRGRLTIFAVAGAASGTLMTSMLKSAVFGSSFGSRPEQPASSSPGRPSRCRSVHVDVFLVVRIDHQRARVGAAAGLDGGDLLRLLHVGDVEDPDAAEALGADLLGTPSVPQSIRPRVCSTDMNSRLPWSETSPAAGADDGPDQPRPSRVLDVVGVEAVETAHDELIAAEREVRVGEAQSVLTARIVLRRIRSFSLPLLRRGCGGVLLGCCRVGSGRRRVRIPVPLGGVGSPAGNLGS